ncbi:MAG: hypothetical protein Q9222_007167 [Ikaeria aurantiellina]
MATRVANYERILEDLGGRVSEADQVLIRKAMDKTTVAEDCQSKESNLEREDSSTSASSRQQFASAEQDAEEPANESQVPARVGSTGSTDRVQEDLNRSAASRGTGFLGKVSEITWIERIRQETDSAVDSEDEGIEETGGSMTFGSGMEASYDDRRGGGKPLRSMSESTYHCDDQPLMPLEDETAFQLPPKAICDPLLAAYLESVHPAFPIIGRTRFLEQYRAFSNGIKNKPGRLWLAILNLIFAIAARYGRLIEADWAKYTNDDATFFSRARLLGLDPDAVWVHVELQRVQVVGLASFYLLSTNQITRAFAMSGIATRQAITLGLHLQNSDPNLTKSSKEIRYRVWWAIATNERTLGVMTGRPTSFTASDCPAPLPMPLDEDAYTSGADPETYNTPAIRKLRELPADGSRSSNLSTSTSSSVSSRNTHRSPSASSMPLFAPLSLEGLYPQPNIGMFFLYSSKLSGLADEVLNQLYQPPVMRKSWADVQEMIVKLREKLEQWRTLLPPVFDFTVEQAGDVLLRQRMDLAFAYYSTMIIVNRPCLCKMKEKMPLESERGSNIDQFNATSCVLAARSLVDLLPHQPDPTRLYRVTPWWNMVHHLMQAATVLMLELSFRASHCPGMVDELVQAVQKVVRWLYSMSANDKAAGRAWRLSNDLLRKVVPKVGRRMDEDLRWSGVVADGDAPMQELLQQPTSFDPPGSTSYLPSLSAPADYTIPPQSVTSWEPLMFTSYDEYLTDPHLANFQPPPRPQ